MPSTKRKRSHSSDETKNYNPKRRASISRASLDPIENELCVVFEDDFVQEMFRLILDQTSNHKTHSTP